MSREATPQATPYRGPLWQTILVPKTTQATPLWQGPATPAAMLVELVTHCSRRLHSSHSSSAWITSFRRASCPQIFSYTAALEKALAVLAHVVSKLFTEVVNWVWQYQEERNMSFLLITRLPRMIATMSKSLQHVCEHLQNGVKFS